MQLSTIQYNAIMIAIDNAKAEAKAGQLLDPYDQENTDNYTNEQMHQALEEIEDRIITANIPT